MKHAPNFYAWYKTRSFSKLCLLKIKCKDKAMNYFNGYSHGKQCKWAFATPLFPEKARAFGKMIELIISNHHIEYI